MYCALKNIVLPFKLVKQSFMLAVLCSFIQTGFAQMPGVIRPAITSLAPGAIDTAMVEQLFLSALVEKTREKPQEASDLLNRILQMDPKNHASLYELANLRKEQKKYEEAQELLEKAVTVKPDNEWYWRSLADSYEKTNDVAKLEKVFSELIRINPDKHDNYFDLGNAYYIQQRYDDALKLYDRLEKITGPTDELTINRQKIFLKQGKVNLAGDDLEKKILAEPNQIRYYLLLAEIYNSTGKADDALKVLERAKKVDPNNGMVHLALAEIYRDKNNKDASFNELSLAFAIPELDVNQKIRIVTGYFPKFPEPNAKASALELSKIIVTAHPKDARANALYGDMLLQNGKSIEALAAYQKSLAVDNQQYEVREQMVRLQLSNNDLDNVIKDGEETLSFFPNQAGMNYMVGVAWLQKKQYSKALSYLKNATALEFEDKEMLSLAYSSLGDVYHEMKNNKSSDESYEKSLSYNPDNVFTLNNYAYYLSVRNEQLEKAAGYAKRANELQPKNASFEDTYAWILFKQKKYAEAKAWIEKALANGKDKSAVQTEHYGDIMFHTGNIDAAVSNWKKAKEYGSTSPVLDRKINEKKYIE
jgi:tetratricopeptide (TPR) repeat protein